MRRNFETAKQVIPWYELDRIACSLSSPEARILLAGVTSSQRAVRRVAEESAIPPYGRLRTSLVLLFQESIASAQRLYKESV